MWFVGLDVHRESTVASIRNAGGIVIRREVVETARTPLRRIFRDLRGRVKVTCEVGPLAPWVKRTLSTRLREVIVSDMRHNRFLLHGSKTDHIDADKLSELLRINAIRAIHVPGPEEALLRRLAAHYHRMVKDRTRVAQRMKALFLEMGIPIPRGWRAAARISLRGFRDSSVKQVARAYSRQLQIATELVSAARDGLLHGSTPSRLV